MAETRIHPETGKLLKRDARPMVIQYGSMACELDVPGWYPDDDSDAIHSGADLKAADDLFAKLRAQYAAHVKQVRKSLDLTQEEAGELIGGGKRAFQKYESGMATPSDAAVGLIEILSREPRAIEVLKEVRRLPGSGRIAKSAGHKKRTKAIA